jgi:hypothetical protein
MPITADSTCDILTSETDIIWTFLKSDPAYNTMLDAWMNLPRMKGYIRVSAIMRYNLSAAVRHKLVSLNWLETDNESLRDLIRILRLIHGC